MPVRRQPATELSEDDARRLLSESVGHQFAGVVRVVLKGRRRSGWLTITEAAELAGISTRTFQRRLADEGQTFLKLTDETRAELANELITGTDHSLTEIANELGYTESQNFFRAFKRWTGQTPEQYRRGLSE
jgi:AraC-like DNA-binding protein